MTVAIRTEGLTKTFGRTRALRDLDLEVESGQVFGYLGPNGAGKSTTIRILLGLQHPTDGAATVLDMDATRDAVEIHRAVGYLPGDLELFPRLTGQQHVEWFSRVRGDVDPAVLGRLQDRFSPTLDRPVRELSKGNRQKIGLVLAFMSSPQLLILDEPTSGLDPLMQKEFEQLVRETVAEGGTVFLSSHELDEVQRLADRLAILREGELVTTDTVKGIRARAPQRVDARLGRAVVPSAFAELPGVAVMVADGDHVVLEVSGDLAPVLRTLAELDPVDLVVRHASLEELFLDFYRDRGTSGRPSA